MASHLVVVMLLILAMAGYSSGATWCMCKDLPETVLQKTLDYACGAGADCNPTHQSGPCFNPNTVRAHCNYAVNSYFQRKGQAQGSCDFSGTAAVVTNDPSSAGCVYPASASAATSNNPTTGTGTTTVNGPTTTGTSPMITNPNGAAGGIGGINNGLGPAGNGMNTDSMGDGGFSFLMKNNNVSPTTLLLCSFTTIIAILSWWA